MKMLYRSAIAVGFVVSIASAGHAQTTPPQDPRTTPPPAQDPYPGRTLKTPEGVTQDIPARDEPWSLSLSANSAYEGNAAFTGLSEDERELTNLLEASIARAWRLRRGDAQLGASVSRAFYQDTQSLDDFRFTIVAGLGHMLTRRLTWNGNASISSGLARDSQVLTDAGTVLPSSGSARTSSGSSAFSYALTPRSTINWTFSTSGVGFSSAALNGGLTVTSAATFTRQVGRSQTIGATADYMRSFATVVPSNVYGVLGVWTLTAGSGWTVSASGGVRPYDVPGEDGLRTAFAFNGGVTKAVRRNQVVGVLYSKSVEQSFGVATGSNLVQTISANYSLALHRNVTATFGGTVTKGRDPVATSDASDNNAQILQGVLAYRIIPNLSLSVGSSFYGRELRAEERTTSTRTYLALSYNTTWR